MSFFDHITNNRTTCEATSQPFQVCSMCERTLLPHDFYVIAKAYNQGSLALEACQCFSCQAESQDYASEQSMENIMLYSGRRFNEFLGDPIQRKIYHLEDPSCLITGEHLKSSDAFEIYHFNIPSAQLEENNFVLIGPTALEQMGELLSEETRKSWGRFTERLAPDSPEITISPMFFG